MKGLNIGNGIELPVDAVTQSIAILARRGAGKTYTASVVVEETIAAQVPVVILDPTGAWWGLRSSVDGESAGLPVVIFGGDHGDVPLEETAGTVLADVVIEHPGAYVLDMSALPSKRAEQRFAGDFLERLYRAKKPETGPLLLVVDEADVFAPQRPGPEQTRTLGALESIVRRGRIKGLGDLLITQRAAVLNKNVLTQTEILVVMQTTGPQDRAAIKEWIEGNGTPEQRDGVLETLASLERGEAWVWSPSFLRTLVRVQIRPRKTFDSSRTPGTGEAAIAPTAFAKVDLEKLGERISATIEKQKADDPRELRRRIAELEREVAARPTEQVERVVEKVVEVPVLNGQVDKLDQVVDRLAVVAAGIAEVGQSIATAIRQVNGGTSHEPRPLSAVQPVQKARPAPSERPIERRQTIAPSSIGEQPLKAPERAVLAALASYPEGRSQQQVSLLSGYSSTSGTFFGALASLRRSGYIEGKPARLTITSDGLAALGPFDPLPTGPALLDYWMSRLKPPESAILTALIDAWPGALDQATVSERAGYSKTSGTFFGALAKLRKLELIAGSASALVAADEIAEHRL